MSLFGKFTKAVCSYSDFVDIHYFCIHAIFFGVLMIRAKCHYSCILPNSVFILHILFALAFTVFLPVNSILVFRKKICCSAFVLFACDFYAKVKKYV